LLKRAGCENVKHDNNLLNEYFVSKSIDKEKNKNYRKLSNRSKNCIISTMPGIHVDSFMKLIKFFKILRFREILKYLSVFTWFRIQSKPH